MQSSDGVLHVAIEAGAPLDIEADDEMVDAAAMDTVDIGDPRVNHGRGVSEEGVDIVGVQRHVVEVVGVVGELVVKNADSSHGK